MNVRRWADKFRLYCNIFIYIRHIWIKPVLCSRMVSLFHYTYLEHTDAYSPHPVHSKMEVFSDIRFKQRVVIEFLTAEKVHPIEIHRRMQAVCGDQCVDVSTVRCWIRRFKDGELEASIFERQNTKWKSCDCKWSASSRSRWETDPWWFCRKIIMQLWK